MQSWCLPRYFDKVDYEEKRDCKGKYEISTLSLISEIGRQKLMTSRDLAFSIHKVTLSARDSYFTSKSHDDFRVDSMPPSLHLSLPLFSL